MQKLIDKILDGKRITAKEGATLFREGNLFELGMLAHEIRTRKHPEPIVTYVIDRNINYTDICISACKFCAFFKAPEDNDGSVLTFDDLGKKIEETQRLGGDQKSTRLNSSHTVSSRMPSTA